MSALSIYSGIRLAMRTALAGASHPALPTSDNRAWEGDAFTPTPSTAWLREAMRPTAATMATLGASGTVREDFAYLVTLNFPTGTPVTTVDDAADAVRAAFHVGRPFDGAGFAGRVTKAERGALIEVDPDWLAVTVTITAFAHRSNL